MTDHFHKIGPWTEDGTKAACVILHDNRHRLLLQLRDTLPETMGPGQWGIFGGRLELGETPRNCALREIEEELGIRLGSRSVQAFAKTQSPHGTGLYAFTTTTVVKTSDIRLAEGAGFAFLTPDQIANLPVLPAVTTLLHHFFEKHPEFT